MHLNKVLLLLALSASFNAHCAQSKEKEYASLNTTQVGIQSISYKEHLTDFATIGDLSTEVEVNNTVLFASSYTHLADEWGFLLTTQSNLSKEFVEDEWKVEGYGAVQANTNKLGYSDLVAQGVYHFSYPLYMTFGLQVKNLNFIRSDLEGIGRFEELNKAIRDSDKYAFVANPPQIGRFIGSIQEELTYLNGIAGVQYNTALMPNRKKLTWHVGASFAVPFYNTAQNTEIKVNYDVDTIDGYFNGYEFQLNAGLNYEFLPGLALTLGASYLTSEMDEISKDVTNDAGDSLTVAIPDVSFSSMQVTLGLLWVD